jgi:hypothetical protein
MEATRDSITFSTGKSLYINAGIIGLKIAGDPEELLSLSYGYDGIISSPEESWASNALTSGECVELADEMLRRWAEFRAKYASA